VVVVGDMSVGRGGDETQTNYSQAEVFLLVMLCSGTQRRESTTPRRPGCLKLALLVSLDKTRRVRVVSGAVLVYSE
jgi:hypothetical protein